MKLGVALNLGSAKTILDRHENATLDLSNVDAIFVENPLTPIKSVTPMINTCIGVQNLLINETLREQTYKQMGFVNQSADTYLFTLFNGDDFGDWIEFDSSNKLMNDDIGPDCGFVTGVGLKVDNLEVALPTLSKIKELLHKINYHGEVLLGITEQFIPCELHFGHFYGPFGLYAEISKFNGAKYTDLVTGLIDFIQGNRPSCELYDSISLGNIITHPPFPLNMGATPEILAPGSAEKHLWRLRFVLMNYVLATVHGSSIPQARRRMRRTLENLQSYLPILQFRTDYGYNLTYLLCQEKYQRALSKQSDEYVRNYNEKFLPDLTAESRISNPHTEQVQTDNPSEEQHTMNAPVDKNLQPQLLLNH
jgi:hypothetical protein